MDLTGKLAWIRPSRLSMKWELLREEEVLGTMSPPHAFGTSATATFGGSNYSLKKGGIRRPGATIRRIGEESDLATMTTDSFGQETVSFPDGSSYRLSRLGTSDNWTLYRGEKEVLIINRETEGKKPGGTFDLIAPDPHLPELILLCWFVITTAER